MKRLYNTGEAEHIEMFIGVEVEKTPAYGLKTLFVVGALAPENIITIATENDCDHLYFGANQSYDGGSKHKWDHMIFHCLRLGFKCTLDFDVTHCKTDQKWLAEFGKYENFIPQISVKIPNLTQLGENATIKIDDIDFSATNPGVWCHNVSTLTKADSYTDWSEYAKDEVIS